jgi:transposase
MPQEALDKVEEITLDMSESMRKIARTCFVKASQVIDRFDVMKLAFDATQEIRIKHRREAIQAETDAKSKAKILEKEYIAERFDNGDTRKELLARSRYPLFKSGDK